MTGTADKLREYVTSRRTFGVLLVLLYIYGNQCVTCAADTPNNKDGSDKDRTKQPLLTVQIVNATSMTLRWVPLKESGHQRSGGSAISCPVQRYIVRLRENGVKLARAWRLDGDRQSVTIHDLKPSVGYQVRLMTITCEGKRKSSRWVSLTMADLPLPVGNEKQTPGPPTSVRTRTTYDSIYVTWSQPEDSAQASGYMIGYGEGVPDVNWRYVNGLQRDVTISSLKSSTQYVISVRALNNFGKGQVVYDIVNTKETSASILPMGQIEGSLPSPTHLRSKILSPTTAWLHWTDPSLDSQQKIADERYYNVYYQALPNSKNLSVIVKALHVTMYDLQPNKVYQFKVRTVKGAHTSPFSDSITNKTSDTDGASDVGKSGKSSTVDGGLGYKNATIGDDWEEYDYDEELTKSKPDGGVLATRLPRPTGNTPEGRKNGQQLHAEIKKKRAHNVVHESLARTLITNLNQSSAPSSSSSSSSGSTSSTADSPKVSFRSMVQYRVSAYVTWPERLAPCSTTDLVAVAGYIFRYKAHDDAGEFVARNVATNFVLLENLLPNSKYRYQVKYVMDKGSVSAWSQEETLNTNYNPANV